MFNSKTQFKFVNLDNNKSWWVTPVKAIKWADKLLTVVVEPKYRSNSSKHEAIIKMKQVLRNNNYSLHAKFKFAQRVLCVFGHIVTFDMSDYKGTDKCDLDNEELYGLND